MKVVVSEHSGFCFGVRRAVDMALEEAKVGGNKVYTLGPIIHNSFVVEDLAAKGVVSVDNVSDVDEGVLVIRSHGVGSAVYSEACGKGLRVVDATCPFVKKIHELVNDYSEKGYTVIIVGKKDHPEVIGIKGWAKDDVWVVYDPEDVGELPLRGDTQKVCVVAQTTIDKARFENITGLIKELVPGVTVFNTICSATSKRQSAAVELAKRSDVMIVIGDNKSSNTKRLYELCVKHCDNTYAVQSAADVIDISKGRGTIGIVAGASTPDWVIKEVIGRMTEEQIVAEVTEVTAAIAEGVAEDATMADFEKSMVKLHNGQYVKGVVISVSDDAVYVNLGYKADGIIPKSEFKLEDGQKLQDVIADGDEVEVEVVQVNDGDGNVILSRKPVLERAAWAEVINVKENDEIVTVKATEAIKGGVLAVYGEFRVFIPASHLALSYVKKLEAFVGRELQVKFIDIDVRGKRIVASRKIVEAEERQKKEDEFWASHKVGDIVSGKVKNITQFGAFVDIGLFDGLIHISELCWTPVSNVTDEVNVGDEVQTKIVAIDKENKKISLNRRALLPHPWTTVTERLKVDDVVKARVIRLTEFFAIVAVEPHVDATLHISQISYTRIEKLEDALKVGDEIEVKILSIEPEKRRMSVSKKALEPKPERTFNSNRRPKTDKPSNFENNNSPKRRSAKPSNKPETSAFTKENMTINLGDFFPQEMLDEIREAEKN
ncbi:MAG: bifunctional 4-hydroxy-3-methylbut-2-enyl diphosphate reductase/30S ribosomal protein S1 [Clostridia bacterium]|nr:bifunctional 4-hydroxy-3-methylbut-2-enyl diphosphate reductase/30S ribosomal protein S1 [Clostridia bacterium]